MSDYKEFLKKGWIVFPPEEAVMDWVNEVQKPALATAEDPKFSQWHRCQGTWFVGVNVLGNDAAGRVQGGAAFRGAVKYFLDRHLAFGDYGFDAGQVSIIYPGYPKPREGESQAAFAFRRDRDAAHVDGLHPSGVDAARHQNEFQALLLGVSITMADERAAPLVVWEGSHRIMAQLYRKAFDNIAAYDWPKVDLTAAYHAARRQIFASCKRQIVHVPLGGAYLVHRFALHGVAPWQDDALVDPKGRAIVYFRPEDQTDQGRQNWLYGDKWL